MNNTDFKKLAEQLRRPSGEDGIITGERMFENNGNMIRRAIDLLKVREGETILELGYGNGAQLDYLFQKDQNLKYVGVDISDTMHKEAARRNQEKVSAGAASFLLSNGKEIPLRKDSADKFFTVNTIYFWDEHAALLKEIRRVVKPGGTICVALASRNFMEKLPFVRYGFQLFHPEEVRGLLEDVELEIEDILIENEIITGAPPELRERELILALAKNPA